MCRMMIVLSAVLMQGTGRADEVTIRKDGVFELDGKAVFPLGFTTMPAPAALAPSGRLAYSELARHGMVFNRCGGPNWNKAAEDALDLMLDQAARSGVYCAIYLPDLKIGRAHV